MNIYKKIMKYQTQEELNILKQLKQPNIDENLMDDDIRENDLNSKSRSLKISDMVENYQNFNLENSKEKFKSSKTPQKSNSPSKKIKDFNKKILKSRMKRYNDPEDHEIDQVYDVIYIRGILKI